MSRVSPLLFPLVFFWVFAGGCGDDSSGPDPGIDYGSIETISYSEHVQPLFDRSCNSQACHNAADRASDLSLAAYDHLASGGSQGSAVIPFHATRSVLYRRLVASEAPTRHVGDEPLAEDAIAFLGRWIDEGALDDDDHVMNDLVQHKAFVACQGDDGVAVLDMDPGRVDRGLVVRILDVAVPHSVYVDAQRERVYVSRFVTANDNVRVYDAATYELLDQGRAGTFPALMWVTPDGSQLWVTNFDAGANPDHKVRVLDPDDLSQTIASFELPNVGQPHGLAMTAKGDLVFVSNILSSNVSIYATNLGSGSPSVVAPAIALPGGGGQQPQQCVLSADETRLFVSALSTNQVHVLDLTGFGSPGWVPSWVSAPVGASPWHMALSPSGEELWVVNWQGNSVSVLDVRDPDSPQEVTTLRPAHPVHAMHDALNLPMGIGFSPDGTRVYVTSTNGDNENPGHHPPPEGQKHPGHVAIFDATTHELLTLAEVPNFARFVDFHR